MGGSSPAVGVIMGSRSDWATMELCAATLTELGVEYEAKVVSAHRTPRWMVEYASSAESRGLEVIIAAAGGAAHLPGMVASLTTLPVLGVPIESRVLKGVDSLLSIVQMPAGVPVGALAIGPAGATNAAILAASIVALRDERVRDALRVWRQRQSDDVMADRDLPRPAGAPVVPVVPAAKRSRRAGRER